jgi:hypothetical protein
MTTLSLRTIVCNAAAVFSRCYGAVTRQAEQAGCSRQTVYEHARQIEQRLQPAQPPTPPAEVSIPDRPPSLDGPTVRHMAVTAVALGISTRQIEELFRIPLGDDGPDHSTIARWAADAAEKARPILQRLDAACVPKVQTLAIDEIFFGGDRPSSGSSRRA